MKKCRLRSTSYTGSWFQSLRCTTSNLFFRSKTKETGKPWVSGALMSVSRSKRTSNRLFLVKRLHQSHSLWSWMTNVSPVVSTSIGQWSRKHSRWPVSSISQLGSLLEARISREQALSKSRITCWWSHGSALSEILSSSKTFMEVLTLKMTRSSFWHLSKINYQGWLLRKI